MTTLQGGTRQRQVCKVRIGMLHSSGTETHFEIPRFLLSGERLGSVCNEYYAQSWPKMASDLDRGSRSLSGNFALREQMRSHHDARAWKRRRTRHNLQSITALFQNPRNVIFIKAP
jgi:hypothetical protein